MDNGDVEMQENNLLLSNERPAASEPNLPTPDLPTPPLGPVTESPALDNEDGLDSEADLLLPLGRVDTMGMRVVRVDRPDASMFTSVPMTKKYLLRQSIGSDALESGEAVQDFDSDSDEELKISLKGAAKRHIGPRKDPPVPSTTARRDLKRQATARTQLPFRTATELLSNRPLIGPHHSICKTIATGVVVTLLVVMPFIFQVYLSGDATLLAPNFVRVYSPPLFQKVAFEQSSSRAATSVDGLTHNELTVQYNNTKEKCMAAGGDWDWIDDGYCDWQHTPNAYWSRRHNERVECGLDCGDCQWDLTVWTAEELQTASTVCDIRQAYAKENPFLYSVEMDVGGCSVAMAPLPRDVFESLRSFESWMVLLPYVPAGFNFIGKRPVQIAVQTTSSRQTTFDHHVLKVGDGPGKCAVTVWVDMASALANLGDVLIRVRGQTPSSIHMQGIRLRTDSRLVINATASSGSAEMTVYMRNVSGGTLNIGAKTADIRVEDCLFQNSDIRAEASTPVKFTSRRSVVLESSAKNNLCLFASSIESNSTNASGQPDGSFTLTTRGTVTGASCSFPFTHAGVQYDSCVRDASVNNSMPFCQTADGKRGFCDVIQTVSIPRLLMENETGVGSYEVTLQPDKEARCHFPFKYNGQTFHSCTTVDSITANGSAWCSVDRDYIGRWGICDCSPYPCDAMLPTPRVRIHSGHGEEPIYVVAADQFYHDAYFHADQTFDRETGPVTDTRLQTDYTAWSYEQGAIQTTNPQFAIIEAPDLASDLRAESDGSFVANTLTQISMPRSGFITGGWIITAQSVYLLFNPTLLSVMSLGMLTQQPVAVPGGGATLKLNRSFCPAVDLTGRNLYTKSVFNQLLQSAGGLPEGYKLYLNEPFIYFASQSGRQYIGHDTFEFISTRVGLEMNLLSVNSEPLMVMLIVLAIVLPVLGAVIFLAIGSIVLTRNITQFRVEIQEDALDDIRELSISSRDDNSGLCRKETFRVRSAKELDTFYFVAVSPDGTRQFDEHVLRSTWEGSGGQFLEKSYVDGGEFGTSLVRRIQADLERQLSIFSFSDKIFAGSETDEDTSTPVNDFEDDSDDEDEYLAFWKNALENDECSQQAASYTLFHCCCGGSGFDTRSAVVACVNATWSCFGFSIDRCLTRASCCGWRKSSLRMCCIRDHCIKPYSNTVHAPVDAVTTSKIKLRIKVEASHLPNMETKLRSSCERHMCCTKSDKTDPMVVLSRRNTPSAGTWQQIGRTEILADELNPRFKISFDIDVLARGKQQLKVDVYDISDWKALESDAIIPKGADLIGTSMFTIAHGDSLPVPHHNEKAILDAPEVNKPGFYSSKVHLEMTDTILKERNERSCRSYYRSSTDDLDCGCCVPCCFCCFYFSEGYFCSFRRCFGLCRKPFAFSLDPTVQADHGPSVTLFAENLTETELGASNHFDLPPVKLRILKGNLQLTQRPMTSAFPEPASSPEIQIQLLNKSNKQYPLSMGQIKASLWKMSAENVLEPVIKPILSGATEVMLQDGVATFRKGSMAVSETGRGYRFVFTSTLPGVKPACSDTFKVKPAKPTCGWRLLGCQFRAERSVRRAAGWCLDRMLDIKTVLFHVSIAGLPVVPFILLESSFKNGRQFDLNTPMDYGLASGETALITANSDRNGNSILFIAFVFFEVYWVTLGVELARNYLDMKLCCLVNWFGRKAQSYSLLFISFMAVIYITIVVMWTLLGIIVNPYKVAPTAAGIFVVFGHGAAIGNKMIKFGNRVKDEIDTFVNTFLESIEEAIVTQSQIVTNMGMSSGTGAGKGSKDSEDQQGGIQSLKTPPKQGIERLMELGKFVRSVTCALDRIQDKKLGRIASLQLVDALFAQTLAALPCDKKPGGRFLNTLELHEIRANALRDLKKVYEADSSGDMRRSTDDIIGDADKVLNNIEVTQLLQDYIKILSSSFAEQLVCIVMFEVMQECSLETDEISTLIREGLHRANEIIRRESALFILSKDPNVAELIRKAVSGSPLIDGLQTPELGEDPAALEAALQKAINRLHEVIVTLETKVASKLPTELPFAVQLRSALKKVSKGKKSLAEDFSFLEANITGSKKFAKAKRTSTITKGGHLAYTSMTQAEAIKAGVIKAFNDRMSKLMKPLELILKEVALNSVTNTSKVFVVIETLFRKYAGALSAGSVSTSNKKTMEQLLDGICQGGAVLCELQSVFANQGGFDVGAVTNILKVAESCPWIRDHLEAVYTFPAVPTKSQLADTVRRPKKVLNFLLAFAQKLESNSDVWAGMTALASLLKDIGVPGCSSFCACLDMCLDLNSMMGVLALMDKTITPITAATRATLAEPTDALEIIEGGMADAEDAAAVLRGLTSKLGAQPCEIMRNLKSNIRLGAFELINVFLQSISEQLLTPWNEVMEPKTFFGSLASLKSLFEALLWVPNDQEPLPAILPKLIEMINSLVEPLGFALEEAAVKAFLSALKVGAFVPVCKSMMTLCEMILEGKDNLKGTIVDPAFASSMDADGNAVFFNVLTNEIRHSAPELLEGKADEVLSQVIGALIKIAVAPPLMQAGLLPETVGALKSSIEMIVSVATAGVCREAMSEVFCAEDVSSSAEFINDDGKHFVVFEGRMHLIDLLDEIDEENQLIRHSMKVHAVNVTSGFVELRRARASGPDVEMIIKFKNPLCAANIVTTISRSMQAVERLFACLMTAFTKEAGSPLGVLMECINSPVLAIANSQDTRLIIEAANALRGQEGSMSIEDILQSVIRSTSSRLSRASLERLKIFRHSLRKCLLLLLPMAGDRDAVNGLVNGLVEIKSVMDTFVEITKALFDVAIADSDNSLFTIQCLKCCCSFCHAIATLNLLPADASDACTRFAKNVEIALPELDVSIIQVIELVVGIKKEDYEASADSVLEIAAMCGFQELKTYRSTMMVSVKLFQQLTGDAVNFTQVLTTLEGLAKSTSLPGISELGSLAALLRVIANESSSPTPTPFGPFMISIVDKLQSFNAIPHPEVARMILEAIHDLDSSTGPSPYPVQIKSKPSSKTSAEQPQQWATQIDNMMRRMSMTAVKPIEENNAYDVEFLDNKAFVHHVFNAVKRTTRTTMSLIVEPSFRSDFEAVAALIDGLQPRCAAKASVQPDKSIGAGLHAVLMGTSKTSISQFWKSKADGIRKNSAKAMTVEDVKKRMDERELQAGESQLKTEQRDYVICLQKEMVVFQKEMVKEESFMEERQRLARKRISIHMGQEALMNGEDEAPLQLPRHANGAQKWQFLDNLMGFFDKASRLPKKRLQTLLAVPLHCHIFITEAVQLCDSMFVRPSSSSNKDVKWRVERCFNKAVAVLTIMGWNQETQIKKAIKRVYTTFRDLRCKCPDLAAQKKCLSGQDGQGLSHQLTLVLLIALARFDHELDLHATQLKILLLPCDVDMATMIETCTTLNHTSKVNQLEIACRTLDLLSDITVVMMRTRHSIRALSAMAATDSEVGMRALNCEKHSKLVEVAANLYEASTFAALEQNIANVRDQIGRENHKFNDIDTPELLKLAPLWHDDKWHKYLSTSQPYSELRGILYSIIQKICHMLCRQIANKVQNAEPSVNEGLNLKENVARLQANLADKKFHTGEWTKTVGHSDVLASGQHQNCVCFHDQLTSSLNKPARLLIICARVFDHYFSKEDGRDSWTFSGEQQGANVNKWCSKLLKGNMFCERHGDAILSSHEQGIMDCVEGMLYTNCEVRLEKAIALSNMIQPTSVAAKLYEKAMFGGANGNMEVIIAQARINRVGGIVQIARACDDLLDESNLDALFVKLLKPRVDAARDARIASLCFCCTQDLLVMSAHPDSLEQKTLTLVQRFARINSALQPPFNLAEIVRNALAIKNSLIAELGTNFGIKKVHADVLNKEKEVVKFINDFMSKVDDESDLDKDQLTMFFQKCEAVQEFIRTHMPETFDENLSRDALGTVEAFCKNEQFDLDKLGRYSMVDQAQTLFHDTSIANKFQSLSSIASVTGCFEKKKLSNWVSFAEAVCGQQRTALCPVKALKHHADTILNNMQYYGTANAEEFRQSMALIISVNIKPALQTICSQHHFEDPADLTRDAGITMSGLIEMFFETVMSLNSENESFCAKIETLLMEYRKAFGVARAAKETMAAAELKACNKALAICVAFQLPGSETLEAIPNLLIDLAELEHVESVLLSQRCASTNSCARILLGTECPGAQYAVSLSEVAISLDRNGLGAESAGCCATAVRIVLDMIRVCECLGQPVQHLYAYFDILNGLCATPIARQDESESGMLESILRRVKNDFENEADEQSTPQVEILSILSDALYVLKNVSTLSTARAVDVSDLDHILDTSVVKATFAVPLSGLFCEGCTRSHSELRSLVCSAVWTTVIGFVVTICSEEKSDRLSDECDFLIEAVQSLSKMESATVAERIQEIYHLSETEEHGHLDPAVMRKLFKRSVISCFERRASILTRDQMKKKVKENEEKRFTERGADLRNHSFSEWMKTNEGKKRSDEEKQLEEEKRLDFNAEMGKGMWQKALKDAIALNGPRGLAAINAEQRDAAVASTNSQRGLVRAQAWSTADDRRFAASFGRNVKHAGSQAFRIPGMQRLLLRQTDKYATCCQGNEPIIAFLLDQCREMLHGSFKMFLAVRVADTANIQHRTLLNKAMTLPIAVYNGEIAQLCSKNGAPAIAKKLKLPGMPQLAPFLKKLAQYSQEIENGFLAASARCHYLPVDPVQTDWLKEALKKKVEEDLDYKEKIGKKVEIGDSLISQASPCVCELVNGVFEKKGVFEIVGVQIKEGELGMKEEKLVGINEGELGSVARFFCVAVCIYVPDFDDQGGRVFPVSNSMVTVELLFDTGRVSYVEKTLPVGAGVEGCVDETVSKRVYIPHKAKGPSQKRTSQTTEQKHCIKAFKNAVTETHPIINACCDILGLQPTQFKKVERCVCEVLHSPQVYASNNPFPDLAVHTTTLASQTVHGTLLSEFGTPSLSEFGKKTFCWDKFFVSCLSVNDELNFPFASSVKLLLLIRLRNESAFESVVSSDDSFTSALMSAIKVFFEKRKSNLIDGDAFYNPKKPDSPFISEFYKLALGVNDEPVPVFNKRSISDPVFSADANKTVSIKWIGDPSPAKQIREKEKQSGLLVEYEGRKYRVELESPPKREGAKQPAHGTSCTIVSASAEIGGIVTLKHNWGDSKQPKSIGSILYTFKNPGRVVVQDDKCESDEQDEKNEPRKGSRRTSIIFTPPVASDSETQALNARGRQPNSHSLDTPPPVSNSTITVEYEGVSYIVKTLPNVDVDENVFDEKVFGMCSPKGTSVAFENPLKDVKHRIRALIEDIVRKKDFELRGDQAVIKGVMAHLPLEIVLSKLKIGMQEIGVLQPPIVWTRGLRADSAQSSSVEAEPDLCSVVGDVIDNQSSLNDPDFDRERLVKAVLFSLRSIQLAVEKDIRRDHSLVTKQFWALINSFILPNIILESGKHYLEDQIKGLVQSEACKRGGHWLLQKIGERLMFKMVQDQVFTVFTESVRGSNAPEVAVDSLEKMGIEIPAMLRAFLLQLPTIDGPLRVLELIGGEVPVPDSLKAVQSATKELLQLNIPFTQNISVGKALRTKPPAMKAVPGNPEQVHKQLQAFARSNEPYLDFHSLTRAERGIVHVAAAALGLTHESIGSSDARRIRVGRPAHDSDGGTIANGELNRRCLSLVELCSLPLSQIDELTGTVLNHWMTYLSPEHAITLLSAAEPISEIMLIELQRCRPTTAQKRAALGAQMILKSSQLEAAQPSMKGFCWGIKIILSLPPWVANKMDPKGPEQRLLEVLEPVLLNIRSIAKMKQDNNLPAVTKADIDQLMEFKAKIISTIVALQEQLGLTPVQLGGAVAGSVMFVLGFVSFLLLGVEVFGLPGAAGGLINTLVVGGGGGGASAKSASGGAPANESSPQIEKLKAKALAKIKHIIGRDLQKLGISL